jgi:hypothetical protein
MSDNHQVKRSSFIAFAFKMAFENPNAFVAFWQEFKNSVAVQTRLWHSKIFIKHFQLFNILELATPLSFK